MFKFNEDFLGTGKYTKENTKQDYITVEEENNTYKLNINNYIGNKEINKSTEKNQVQIEVLEEKTYMDYQIFKIKVKNNSQSDIRLDDGQDIKAMYIEDKNGIQYSAYTHELSDAQLRILPKTSKEITIKYYNKYSSNRKIKKIVFSKIILNNNSNQPRNYGSIEINL